MSADEEMDWLLLDFWQNEVFDDILDEEIDPRLSAFIRGQFPFPYKNTQ